MKNIFYTHGFFIIAVIFIIAIVVYSFICWVKSDSKNADIDLPVISDILEE